MKNINQMDLNLLIVFNALAVDQNTTKAAKRLNLSQPAISHSLARLREMFADPLFVRASKGLAPTARAIELMPKVAEVVEKAQMLLQDAPHFDPQKEDRVFRISTTDYFELVALPEILKRLSIEAPNIRLLSRPTSGQLPKEALESGEFDLAIAGFYGDLPEGYFQQLVFKDEFVCVGKKGNKNLANSLNIKKYAQAKHILISPDGDMKSKSARVLEKQGYDQDFILGTFSFTSPGWMIAQTDLLLTCPRRLAKTYQQFLPVEIHELPFTLTPISVLQVWQNRQHKDKAHIWLRNLIKDVCSSKLPEKSERS